MTTRTRKPPTFDPELLDRAVAILRRYGPMRASDLGWRLWGETTEAPDRGEGSHRQAKFCRSAGKILKALDRESRVVDRTHGNARLWEAV